MALLFLFFCISPYYYYFNVFIPLLLFFVFSTYVFLYVHVYYDGMKLKAEKKWVALPWHLINYVTLWNWTCEQHGTWFVHFGSLFKLKCCVLCTYNFYSYRKRKTALCHPIIFIAVVKTTTTTILTMKEEWRTNNFIAIYEIAGYSYNCVVKCHLVAKKQINYGENYLG